MKTLKKVLSMAMALALLVTGLVVAPVDAEAAEYTASLSFCDSAWGSGMWGTEESAITTVTGDGSYSVSWTVPEGTTVPDAGVFVIDIAGAQAAMDAEGKTWEVTALSVKVDGTELAVDVSKVLTGDLEGNGNYRIEIYNMVGAGTADNPPVDNKAVTFSQSLTVDFTIATIDKPAEGGDTTPVTLDTTAALSFCDSAWGSGMWATEESAVVPVTGDGSYSVSWTVPEGTTVPDAGVFVIDFAGAQAAMDAESKTWEVTALTVKVDGTELAVDLSKILAGDLEENGNYRIEIYNMVGAGTADNPPVDNKAVTFSQNLTVDFTIKTVAKVSDGTDDGGEDKAPVAAFDPKGTYNAYIGIQTPTYTFRNAWNDGDYGKGTAEFDQITKWVDNVATNNGATITDVAVAGNGTYKVSITNLPSDFADEFASQDYFNLLFISTDIPLSDDVKITDVKLILDGKTVHSYAEAYLDGDDGDYFKVLIQNIYNEEVKELPYYAAPTKSIEMEFTISGFDYDNAAQGGDEPDTTPDTQNPADTQGNAGTDDKAGNNDGNIIPIVIAVVVVVVVAVVVVVVLKKKKAE